MMHRFLFSMSGPDKLQSRRNFNRTVDDLCFQLFKLCYDLVGNLDVAAFQCIANPFVRQAQHLFSTYRKIAVQCALYDIECCCIYAFQHAGNDVIRINDILIGVYADCDKIVLFCCCKYAES